MIANRRNFIFLIPLSFFTLQFLLRVIPGIFSEDMMKHFTMNASEFGIFSSIYYLGYSSMQIPVGLMLDKFGTRKIVTILIFLCAFSSIGLTVTDSKIFANLFRFTIGVCSVAGYIGCVKVAKEIYSAKIYNKIIGLTFSVGFSGAALTMLISGRGLSLGSDWKSILITTSMILLVIAIFSNFVLNNRPTVIISNVKENIKLVFKDKYLLLTAIAGGLMVGVFEGFSDIWGKNFLKLSYNLNDLQAVTLAALIYLGLGLGAPIITYLADKTQNHALITVITGIMIALLFAIILFSNVNYSILVLICFTIGILSGNQVLIFTMNTFRSQEHVVALTAAVTNSLVMGFGIFFHAIIGCVLDFMRNCRSNSKIFYSLEDYRSALLVIPLSCIVGSLIILVINSRKLNS